MDKKKAKYYKNRRIFNILVSDKQRYKSNNSPMDKHKVIEIFITVDDFCKGFDEIECKGLFQLEIRNSEIENHHCVYQKR